MTKMASLLLLGMFLIQESSNAQAIHIQSVSKKITLGFEIGPGLASLRGNDVVDKYNSSLFVFSSGASLQYHLNDKFSLKSGIAYERKGNYSNPQVVDYNGNLLGYANSHMHLNYLVVPVLFKAEIGRQLKWFFNAGPYIGFLLDAKESIKLNGEESTMDLTDTYESTDLGISGGAGLAYQLNTQLGLSFEIRDDWGLKNIGKNVANNQTIKNNSIQFLLGLSFMLN